MRGYGRSSRPGAIDQYRMLRMVGDNVALVSALGEQQAVVVGHDWGAPIAWNSALLRPDVFRGVAGLSVPFSPPGDVRPTAAFRLMGGAEEFYIEYFQQPGRAEAEIEADIRRWLLGFYFTASGDAPPPDPSGTVATVAKGGRMCDRFRYPDPMPAWLTEEDLDIYVAEFEYSGFRARAAPLPQRRPRLGDLQAMKGASIQVPALFIGGDKDGPTLWGAPAIERFPETLPKLHRSLILEGCGHWTQQERATEVNAALVDFLGSLS